MLHIRSALQVCFACADSRRAPASGSGEDSFPVLCRVQKWEFRFAYAAPLHRGVPDAKSRSRHGAYILCIQMAG